ncbi:MAG TPA: adenylate/guanylate cyclase domain-containing protein [Actinomycetota bacterium]|nr:adenylate/guanylate cyclase domain-containing protein [Actinomycetota bacterium]
MRVCSACGRENPDDAAFCMACASPLEPATLAREQRKTVTVVFCDLVGSTTLAERHDPEVLRPLLGRYFEEMRAAIERHGGAVEKFIGDAVVAVFGMPQVHEDDALRAVRAATEMRERLTAFADSAAVELVGRIGLTTGEVLVGGEEQPPVGDTMNTAARLQSAAEPGEILIGEPTYRLVRDAVVAEPIEPLALRGKAGPVQAYRLLQVASLSPVRTRRLDAPMVGRDRERALLQQAFERAVSDRACQLFTVLGAAGAGKSRLVEEFLAPLARADVMQGRCLPYGDGITYFPVTEAMKETLGLADFDDESAVHEKIHAAVADEEHAEEITANLSKLLGAGQGGAAEETFWAIRRFLEARGRRRPAVVVFDDIHWGEPTFLDLVEHIADWSRDASILLLCMARSDLLDERPAWAGGKTNATTISLAPLSLDECAELIDHLLGSSGLPTEVRDRITTVSEGNPLFVEEMLLMLIDDGLLAREGDRWTPTGSLEDVSVPPTISVLLSARLDRLSDAERTLLERAAVCGKEFHRGALLELLPEAARSEADVHLRSLVRKELVGPERSSLPGEDAYRFRHLLIRDATYDAIPKHERADLHEGFANWLERVAGERIAEQEEILGYHLERTCRLRAELGDDPGGRIAARAATHLAAAGRRSYERGDTAAAVNLLSRALDLAPGGSAQRVRIGIDLGRSLAWTGEEVRAIEVIGAMNEAASAIGDEALRMHAELALIEFRAWRDQPAVVEWAPTAERAMEVFERTRDQAGLARAWDLLAWHHVYLNRFEEASRAAERGLVHARAAGDRGLELELLGEIANVVWGPVPVTEALARCDEVARQARGNRSLSGVLCWHRAALVAMRGDIDEARRLYAEGRGITDELGRLTESAFAVQQGWYVEMLARDFRRVEELTRAEYGRLLAADSRALLGITRDLLALAVCAQGRFEEAEALAKQTEREPMAEDDVTGQNVWRRVRAKALSARGEHEEAVRLARQAEALFEGTDAVIDHGEALLDLADVLRAAGEVGEATAAAREALALYERKENVVEAGRARAFLGETGTS